MGFLRRLFGGQAKEPTPRALFTIEIGPAPGYDPADGMCFVSVGGVTIPAAIYRDNQRDVEDWSSGIRLEDPRTGRMLVREDRYPLDFALAGARSVAVVGLPYYADAQRDEFSVGSRVRLVPEPTNPVNPRAIAIRSADGRYQAGHVPDDDLDRISSTEPLPTVGLIVWEGFTWRPRVRTGLIALVGPSVDLRLVAATQAAREAVRRQEAYARGRALEDAEREASWEAAAKAKVERQAERQRLAAERATVREAAASRKVQVAAWREAGVCVDCGATIDPVPGRGRRPIRCAAHRA